MQYTKTIFFTLLTRMVTVLTHVIVYRSLLLFVHQVRHFFDTGLKLLTSCKMGFFNFIPLMQQIFLVCCCHLVVCFVLVFQTTSKSVLTIFLRKIIFFKFFQMVLRFCPGVYVCTAWVEGNSPKHAIVGIRSHSRSSY